MRTRIRRCGDCGTYTLQDRCPLCGTDTGPSAPARFSPEDPYGRYRRQLKREEAST